MLNKVHLLFKRLLSHWVNAIYTLPLQPVIFRFITPRCLSKETSTDTTLNENRLASDCTFHSGGIDAVSFLPYALDCGYEKRLNTFSDIADKHVVYKKNEAFCWISSLVIKIPFSALNINHSSCSLSGSMPFERREFYVWQQMDWIKIISINGKGLVEKQ